MLRVILLRFQLEDGSARAIREYHQEVFKKLGLDIHVFSEKQKKYRKSPKTDLFSKSFSEYETIKMQRIQFKIDQQLLIENQKRIELIEIEQKRIKKREKDIKQIAQILQDKNLSDPSVVAKISRIKHQIEFNKKRKEDLAKIKNNLKTICKKIINDIQEYEDRRLGIKSTKKELFPTVTAPKK